MTTLNFFKWSAWIQRLSVRMRLRRSPFPDSSCLRPPHSSNASITITGSSSRRTSSPSIDSGSSMSNLQSRSMSDELCPWVLWVKCDRRERGRQARSQATARQSALVVIVINCVRLNRNEITCMICVGEADSPRGRAPSRLAPSV